MFLELSSAKLSTCFLTSSYLYFVFRLTCSFSSSINFYIQFFLLFFASQLLCVFIWTIWVVFKVEIFLLVVLLRVMMIFSFFVFVFVIVAKFELYFFCVLKRSVMDFEAMRRKQWKLFQVHRNKQISVDINEFANIFFFILQLQPQTNNIFKKFLFSISIV